MIKDAFVRKIDQKSWYKDAMPVSRFHPLTSMTRSADPEELRNPSLMLSTIGVPRDCTVAFMRELFATTTDGVQEIRAKLRMAAWDTLKHTAHYTRQPEENLRRFTDAVDKLLEELDIRYPSSRYLDTRKCMHIYVKRYFGKHGRPAPPCFISMSAASPPDVRPSSRSDGGCYRRMTSIVPAVQNRPTRSHYRDHCNISTNVPAALNQNFTSSSANSMPTKHETIEISDDEGLDIKPALNVNTNDVAEFLLKCTPPMSHLIRFFTSKLGVTNYTMLMAMAAWDEVAWEGAVRLYGPNQQSKNEAEQVLTWMDAQVVRRGLSARFGK